MKMRKIKRQLGSILAFAFLIFLLLYLASNRELLTPLLEVPIELIIILAMVKLAQIFINGFFTKITLNAFNKPISQKESAYIALLSSLGNYFGPLLGGFGVRAAYLKKKYDFAFTHFVGTTYGYYLVSFFTSAVVGLASLAVIYNRSHIYSAPATFGLLFVAISTGILFFLKVPKKQELLQKKYVGRFYKRLLQINEGWEILISHKRLFGKMLGLGFIMLVVGFITSWIEFIALDIPYTVEGLLLYSTLGGLSLLISFTPGAIGIRETIYVITSSVLMISNSEILQLAALDRSVSLAVLSLTYIYLQFISKVRNKV